MFLSTRCMRRCWSLGCLLSLLDHWVRSFCPKGAITGGMNELDSMCEMEKITLPKIFLFKLLKYFESHCLKNLRNARNFTTKHKRRPFWS